MMKKLGIVVMAGLFTISVAGLSMADEMKGMKHDAAPASTGAAAKNPCDPTAKEVKKAGAKKGQEAGKEKTKKGEGSVTMDPLPAAKK